LHTCNSRESAAADRGGMSTLHQGVQVRLVRELPLALEPVTRDPFIDDGRRPVVRRTYISQRDLVRESLLRCPGGEERL
jgi:hypothetical protein